MRVPGVYAVSFCLATTTLLTTPNDARADEGDVVYHHSIRVASDGTRSESESGDLEVVLGDGTRETLDLERLEDADGRRYAIVVDAAQEDEDADVVYETRVIRIDPEKMDLDARIDAYKDIYPDATSEEIDALKARIERSAEVPVRGLVVDEEVQWWLESAEEGDTTEVFVRVDGAGPLRLPKVDLSLLDDEPLYALEVLEQRETVIELRKTEVYELQEALLAALSSRGGELIYQSWVLNGFHAEVGPDALAWLLERPEVRRVEAVYEAHPDADTGNNGDEIRAFSQVNQFLDAGIDGSIASIQGMSPTDASVDAIYVGIIDMNLDPDHPAWEDDLGNSRLVDAWWRDTGWEEDTGSGGGAEHGNLVAGLLLADLMDGQDAGVTDPDEQAARSGFATGAKFSFIDYIKGSASLHASLEFALDDFVFDVMNVSISGGDCVDGDANAEDVYSEIVNDLYMNNVLLVKAAGNDGHDTADGCTVTSPGGAAGAFSVGSLDATVHPLTDTVIGTLSSRGGDAFGRSIIGLVAPSGHEAPTVPRYDDTYGLSSAGALGYTSYAAPHVAGAAAILKHHLINVLGSTNGNKVGWLISTMLVMGDGRMEDGSTAGATTVYDDLYGAGRLRMRRFHDAGMDAPWRARWLQVNIEDSDTIDWLVNPNSGGVNQSVSSDVEWFKAAVWWYEPNLYYEGPADPDNEEPAEIRFRVCRTAGCYVYGTLDDHKHRLWLGNVIAGDTWTVSFDGVNIPASTDPDHWAYGEQKRTLFATMFWEDRDSDDGDGPDIDLDGDGPDTGVY